MFHLESLKDLEQSAVTTVRKRINGELISALAVVNQSLDTALTPILLTEKRVNHLQMIDTQIETRSWGVFASLETLSIHYRLKEIVRVSNLYFFLSLCSFSFPLFKNN